MAAKLEVYKCETCGNIIEVVQGGVGELVCCGMPMDLLEEKTADAATEKHVPVVEEVDNGVLVKVGSVPHPMADEHYIQWIELLLGEKVLSRVSLAPGDEPQALFPKCPHGTPASELSAREYCNVHGLWKA
jgi:superoxide reductase